MTIATTGNPARIDGESSTPVVFVDLEHPPLHRSVPLSPTEKAVSGSASHKPWPMDDESSRTTCTTRSSHSTASSSSHDDESDEERDDCSFDSRHEPGPLLPRHNHDADGAMRNCGNLTRLQCGKLVFGTLGIYIAYLSYGMIQEDLYRYKRVVETYDDSEDAMHSSTTIVFTSVWFLQVLESTASILVGSLARYCYPSTSTSHPRLSIRPFLLSGTTQVLAKVLMSLSLVAGASFPVATLAKSAKIVPVMMGQFLLGGSTYGHRDCTFAILVVVGTVLLSLGSSTSGRDSDANDTWMGVVLIALSLVMDGCTGGLQKQLLRNLSARPSTYDFVVYSHMAMVLVALVVSVVSGDLVHGMECLAADAHMLRMVTCLCAWSVLGQFFIFYIIAQFDPLVCATITTTRKIWSVLLSIGFHGHALSSMGYGGLTLAISGLLIEIHGKLQPSKPASPSYRNEKTHWEQQRLVSQPQ